MDKLIFCIDSRRSAACGDKTIHRKPKKACRAELRWKNTSNSGYIRTPNSRLSGKKTFGCCLYVYNHFLAERIETYKNETKSVSRFEQDKKLALLKQETGRNNEKPGFPRFKRKRDSRKSYKSKAVGKNIEVFEKEIKLPKMGSVECRVSKKVSGRILSATVSQNPIEKYFVSVCCTDVEIP